MRGSTLPLRCLTSTAFLFCLAFTAQAATYVVQPDGSGDFETIAAAILAATAGDTIELGNGVFSGPGNTGLSLQGKSIEIRSQSGDPARCIIDCAGQSGGFSFITGEGAATMLAGITLLNGHSTYGAGIICADGARPIIRRCVITGASSSVGGAVYCNDASPLFDRCRFIGNSAIYGGGLACRNFAHPTLAACTFVGNSSAHGGAVTSEFDSAPLLLECTLYANQAADGAGVFCRERSTVRLENSIVAFGLSGAAVSCLSGGVSLACSDVYGNAGGDWVDCITDQLGIDGNICADPLFCDAAAQDLRLQADSPCLPFTSPADGCELMGAWGVGCGHALVAADGSGDFPTIQAALDALADGDVICLAPGTYRGTGNRDLDFHGKAIQLMPLDIQAEPPVIDCEETGRGFIFQSAESRATVVTGCKITNGAASQGAGLYCDGAAPSFSHCIFTGNSASEGGGAFCTNAAAPVFQTATFSENSATSTGGALTATGGATVTIAHSSFGSNSAPTGAGIAASGAGGLTVDHTLIAFGLLGEAISCESGGYANLVCCDLFGNAAGDWIGPIAEQYGVNGNISEDPLLCDSGTMDLDDRSPCLPDNPENPGCGVIGARLQGCQAPHVFIVRPDGSGDFATIQDAVYACRQGDTVLLSDGIFTGPGNCVVTFAGRVMTIASQSGDPQRCIIDGEGQSQGFLFEAGEGPLAVLRDITLRRCTAGGG